MGSYTLEEFHTHTPSEHKVAGRHYDMEMQFVHTAQVDGVSKTAIVAVFYERGDRSPSFIKQLMRQALPKATSQPADLAPNLDFRVCLPLSRHRCQWLVRVLCQNQLARLPLHGHANDKMR